MRLDFDLLIIDDEPPTQAIRALGDHLEAKGFTLRERVAEDLSEAGLRKLARSEGKDFNLVMVDFNLGDSDTNGAVASAKLRREMPYTDMVFYSSESPEYLLEQLAGQKAEGVFVENRRTLDEKLKGLADTVIGKAVDLNHMRGIAMAEVADMDVQMEEILENVFRSPDECFTKNGIKTLKRLSESADKQRKNIAALVDNQKIMELVVDPQYFSLAHKYNAIVRVARCLKKKPEEALAVLETFDADIIANRNTLAHAKEDKLDDGTLTLRAIKRGKADIRIDDVWMSDFRGKLRQHRHAIGIVCLALRTHLDGLAVAQKPQESKP